jgi:AraC family transcriptional regulator, regulatory protein of adaptative response / methylated-DNA-[protein]-cysteine methyltransferase
LHGKEEYTAFCARIGRALPSAPTGQALPMALRRTKRGVAAPPERTAARKIPVSVAVSDTDIARRISLPKSVRAVARACGANPLAAAIPCHRVVRNDGVWSG